jgi:ferredoxin
VSPLDLLDADVPAGPAPTAGTSPPAVLLCSDLAAEGLDLGELQAVLADRLPGAAVLVVDHLCERPRAAAATVRELGATRAVLASCRRRLPEQELRAHLRRSGLRLSDADILRVPRTHGVQAAAKAIAASHARVAHTPPHEPSRMRVTSGRLSRNALLHVLPAMSQQPIAAVDLDRCMGVARCGNCVAACPTGAIAVGDGGFPQVASADCDACTRCLPSCPAAAIRITGAAPRQIEAQLASLLDAAAPARILFACANSLRTLDDEAELEDWSPVELPGLAAATPGWVLQTLLGGAARVRLWPCDHACCSPWQSGGSYLDLCLRLLPADLAARLSVAAPDKAEPAQSPGTGPTTGPLTLAEPEATASAVQALTVDVRLAHAASPLGLLEIDPGCTTCGACSAACPTNALTLVEDTERVELWHDARLCTGCNVCARVCPEDVVRVERAIDTRRLRTGAVGLASTARRRCGLCDAPLPPTSISDRNRRLLADRWPLLAAASPDLCMACASRETRPTPGDRPRPPS